MGVKLLVAKKKKGAQTMQNRTKIGLATGANVIASLITKLYYFSLNEINTMV